MSALSPATAADLPSIMQIERGEGYEAQVGRWSYDRHLTELGESSTRYLIGRQADGIVGFAILQNVGSANDCILLRRIAVHTPGLGVGAALLDRVVEHAFEALGAHRLELKVFVTNERAYRAYLRAGFVEEGILRDLHKNADGSFASMRMMALLRGDRSTR